MLSAETRMTLLCAQEHARAFDADAMLRLRARRLEAPPAAPLPCAFWAAGFSFSRGEQRTNT
jgi:hypothetical protein